MTTDLLDRVCTDNPPAFALLHRPQSGGPGEIDLLVGDASVVASLNDLPLPPDAAAGRHEALVVVPYRQISERGFAAVDDGAPLQVLTVRDQDRLPVAEVLRRLPSRSVALADPDFDLDDAGYAEQARTVIAEEIGRGEGSNFVLKRELRGTLVDYTPAQALALFGRLMASEVGAYWTFLVHTGTHTFVGASPERHLSLRDGLLAMNPISGTYRYPPAGPVLDQVLKFLADRKESDELSMVVDEELKMMAHVCADGGRVRGPYLKEMANLAHTEYLIEGHTGRDVRELLRETMFAPTVVGSPLQSACRVVARHEPGGRGYYSGVVALIGRDDRGGRTLDSSIIIRTAVIDAAGGLRVGVGATIVRQSSPESEAAETRAKAAGLVRAMRARAVTFGDHPEVRQALEGRNEGIATFWLRAGGAPATARHPALAGRRVLVVDAEDTFTAMIAVQLRSLGLIVDVRRHDEAYGFDGYDCVVLGPGPGDPRRHDDPKIARLRAGARRLLDDGRPLLAICLSHQVLSDLLGLALVRHATPQQGVQRDIGLFGRRVRVGFYNTYSAQAGGDVVRTPAGLVDVARDTATGEVYALRGPTFRSVQFHAESIFSRDGLTITRDLLVDLLSQRPGEEHDGVRTDPHR